MIYRPSNISPHCVGNSRICSDCCRSIPVAEATAYEPVPGLTMYRCALCVKAAEPTKETQ